MKKIHPFSKILVPLSILVAVISVWGCQKNNGDDVSDLANDTSLAPLEEKIIIPPPDVVTVIVRDYCPAIGRTYKDLFASNFTVKVVNGNLRIDSDKDGVPDFIELSLQSKLGISPLFSDSNSDGFSDLLMYLAGIERTQQTNLRCTDREDNDGDGIYYQDTKLSAGSPPQYIGLNNCEEDKITHTDRSNFDTDGDGIPDYLELRCSLNPNDPNDALLDTDGDGIYNIDECKKNTPISESNDVGSVKYFEYQYSQQFKADLGVQGCYDFTVSNIPILASGTDNMIALYLTELDGAQNAHLYTGYIILPGASSGKTYEIEFGPQPNGRFIAK